MKIYTRTGDDGTTGLFSGGRVSKADLRVEAYGTVDELNAVLGMARVLTPHDETSAWLETVQRQLFHLGADLATPLDAKAEWVVRVEDSAVTWLEERIDTMMGELPELQHFILPGGTASAAQIHIARTVCRRAERLAVALNDIEPLSEHALRYMNRLSDWLFALARWENYQSGEPEAKWSVR